MLDLHHLYPFYNSQCYYHFQFSGVYEIDLVSNTTTTVNKSLWSSSINWPHCPECPLARQRSVVLLPIDTTRHVWTGCTSRSLSIRSLSIRSGYHGDNGRDLNGGWMKFQPALPKSIANANGADAGWRDERDWAARPRFTRNFLILWSGPSCDSNIRGVLPPAHQISPNISRDT